MTVSELLSALTTTTRVDIKVGTTATYRVESNEVAILNSTMLAKEITTLAVAVDGKTPYLVATVSAE